MHREATKPVPGTNPEELPGGATSSESPEPALGVKMPRAAFTQGDLAAAYF